MKELALCLQPYVQSSLAPRSHHMLCFKYFSPFYIVDKINERTSFSRQQAPPVLHALSLPRIPAQAVDRFLANDLRLASRA